MLAAMAKELVYTGDRIYIWRPDSSLWLTVLWDAPSSSDIEAMVKHHDMAYHTPDQFESLVDFSQVSMADPTAFGVLASFVERRRAGFDRQIRKQALVRQPSSMIGAMVTGFFDSFGLTMPVRAFDDRRQALDWLRPDTAESWARELDVRVAAATAISPELRRVRDVLAQHYHAEMDLLRCAQLLGTSERTVQRQLQSAGTSFRTELTQARINAAKRLLQAAECKVAAVAAEVGFASSQSFAVAFREATGESPTEYRSRWLPR